MVLRGVFYCHFHCCRVMSQLPVRLRHAERSDLHLILNSWLESFRKADLIKGVPNRVYFPTHHKILDQLLQRCAVIVMCSDEDPKHILGWCCAELMDNALVIHYTYVKNKFRKMGLAKRMWKRMIESEPQRPAAIIATHRTPAGAAVIKNYIESVKEMSEDERAKWDFPVIYNPYLLFMTLPEDWAHA